MENRDINLHRSVIFSFSNMDLDDRLRLCAFRNLLNDEIDRLDLEIMEIPLNNTFRYRVILRNHLLKFVRCWFELRIMFLPPLR